MLSTNDFKIITVPEMTFFIIMDCHFFFNIKSINQVMRMNNECHCLEENVLQFIHSNQNIGQ